MEYNLIMAVSRFPSLFDTSSVTYRDLNTRSDAWRQVAELVGVSEAECRRKWKMLRDQHRRERQREKERRESSLGLLNYRPWRYSAILSFLNPFIDARAAGTNGWALGPQSSCLQPLDNVGCSTTTETRSDDDDNYGIAVADATTTTTTTTTLTAPSSLSEFAQRKRPASAGADTVRPKEARTHLGSAGSADGVHTQQVQHVNLRELIEMMMSVTSLAASFVSSHSDQLAPPVQSAAATAPSRLGHLKTEQQEAEDEPELLDRADSLGEEPLRRTEAREAQRGRDVDQRDDVTLFLLSLAPAMRRLPAEKQSWLRTRMQQLVHEAEFGPTSFQ